MVLRLKQVVLSGALAYAGTFAGGVVHAAGETVTVASQESTVVSETVSQQSISSSISVVESSITPPSTPPSDTSGGDVGITTPQASTTDVTESDAAADSHEVSAATTVDEQAAPPADGVLTRSGELANLATTNPVDSDAVEAYTVMSQAIWQAIEQDQVPASAPTVAQSPIQPNPVLPPAGSLQLAGVWSAITLPISAFFNPVAIASHAGSYPLTLLLGCLLGLAFAASFVAYLKRAGYAHAARSDAAATNFFATPSLNVSLTRAYIPI